MLIDGPLPENVVAPVALRSVANDFANLDTKTDVLPLVFGPHLAHGVVVPDLCPAYLASLAEHLFAHEGELRATRPEVTIILRPQRDQHLHFRKDGKVDVVIDGRIPYVPGVTPHRNRSTWGGIKMYGFDGTPEECIEAALAGFDAQMAEFGKGDLCGRRAGGLHPSIGTLFSGGEQTRALGGEVAFPRPEAMQGFV